MRLLISTEEDVFEAPTVWLNDSYAPVVGCRALFSSQQEHKPQQGPYNWIKIAAVDTVLVDTVDGTMAWLAATTRTAWCAVHPFTDTGTLHPKVTPSPENLADSEGKEKTVEAAAAKPTLGSQMSQTSAASNLSFDDFDELLENACHIVRDFKSESLRGDALCDAILGLLYVYILPAIGVCASDKALLLKLVHKMGEDAVVLSAAAADSEEKKACSQTVVSQEELTLVNEEEEEEKRQLLEQQRRNASELMQSVLTGSCLALHREGDSWFAEEDIEGDRFSFDIPVKCRSFREMLIRALQRQEYITDHHAAVCNKIHSFVVASTNDEDDDSAELHYSSMAGLALSVLNHQALIRHDVWFWWCEEFRQIVLNAFQDILGKPEEVVRNRNYRKLLFVCADTVFQKVGVEIAEFYAKKMAPVLKKLQAPCHEGDENRTFDKFYAKLITKRRQADGEGDRLEETASNRMLSDITKHAFMDCLHNVRLKLMGVAKPFSPIDKGRILLACTNEMAQALQVVHDNAAADELLDCMVAVLRTLDSATVIHVKLTADFFQLALPKGQGKLSYSLTIFLMAYSYLLTDSKNSQLQAEQDLPSHDLSGVASEKGIGKDFSVPQYASENAESGFDSDSRLNAVDEQPTREVACAEQLDAINNLPEKLPSDSRAANVMPEKLAEAEVLIEKISDAFKDDLLTSDKACSENSSGFGTENEQQHGNSSKQFVDNASGDLIDSKIAAEKLDDPSTAIGTLSVELSGNCEVDRLRSDAAQVWLKFKTLHGAWNMARFNCVQSLEELAEHVQSSAYNSNVTSMAASVAGIASGLAGIAGFALMPFTGGLSSSLLFYSAVGGGLSVATGGGALIYQQVLNSQQSEKAKQLCEDDKAISDSLYEALRSLNALEERLIEMSARDEEGAREAERRYISRSDSLPGLTSSQLALPVNSISQTVTSTAAASIGAPMTKVVGKGAGKALGKSTVLVKTFGRGLRVVGMGFFGVFVAVDIWSLVTTAVDTHKGSRTELGDNIRAIARFLEAERCYFTSTMRCGRDLYH